jgi:biotin operon repressor
MLTLLSLLQTRRDWPGRLLAERLSVSPRTLRRDVENLRDLGYRITAMKGPDGGYRLEAGSELPPMLFDDDQVIALAVALRTASAAGGPQAEASLRALATVRQVMPSRLRHRVDGLRFTTLAVSPHADPAVPAAVLVAVSDAVRAREVLRFDYAGVGGAPHADSTRRRVEPHHVVFRGGRWYLVGWDLDREQWRVFRIDRLEPRIPTGPRFTPRSVPGGDVARFVAARFKGGERGTDWPVTGHAVLRLPARRVIPFADDGVVEELGPDQTRLVLGSWSWTALAAAFARFDAPMTQVTPRELAEAFGILATRMADAVSGESGEPRHRRGPGRS